MLAHVLPRWDTYLFRLSSQHNCQKDGIHRLLRGLPGYLSLFDTHAFVPQRQSGAGTLPSQSEFCAISMHFTATLRIPRTSRLL